MSVIKKKLKRKEMNKKKYKKSCNNNKLKCRQCRQCRQV